VPSILARRLLPKFLLRRVHELVEYYVTIRLREWRELYTGHSALLDDRAYARTSLDLLHLLYLCRELLYVSAVSALRAEHKWAVLSEHTLTAGSCQIS
jgi:hypothetical protein